MAKTSVYLDSTGELFRIENPGASGSITFSREDVGGRKNPIRHIYCDHEVVISITYTLEGEIDQIFSGKARDKIDVYIG